MICVQDEDAVQCALQHRVDLVLFTRRGKHHVQKVAGVAQVIFGVHVGLAYGVLVRHGDQRRHFRDQANGGDLAVLRVGDVRAVVVERRQGTDQAGHDGHRVRVTAKATQEKLHLFVDHGVVGHAVHEIFFLAAVRQLTVKQQVTGFHVIAAGGQLLDRVAAVQKFALVAVNVGDGRLARSG